MLFEGWCQCSDWWTLHRHVENGFYELGDDKLHPLGAARFVTRSDENEQKRIVPDKTGKGQHKVEKDKTSDTTKPPTEKKK